MTIAPAVAAPTIVRDRLTLSLYLFVACWAWLLAALGPALVLLRAEQDVSRSVVSLHGTAIAVGSLFAAAVVVPLGRRLGRWALLQWSILGVSAGVGLFVVAPSIELTLAAALVVGTAGAMGLNIVVPVIAQHHHEVSSAAISEANAAGSTIGLLAPLAVGVAVATELGWRPALAACALLAGACSVLTWRTRDDRSWSPTQPRRVAGASRARLGPAFWCGWVAMTMFIAIEFSTVYWAADLLAGDHGMSAGAASAAVSAFVGGMALGRWVVGALALRFADARLLAIGLAAAAAGWLLLWSGPSPAVAIAGLAVCGAGTGWLFPLGVSVMIRRSEGRPDTAVSLASVAAGLSSGGAPFLLATLADRFGTHQAFLVIPAGIAIGAMGVAGAVVLNRRQLRRARARAGAPVRA